MMLRSQKRFYPALLVILALLLVMTHAARITTQEQEIVQRAETAHRMKHLPRHRKSRRRKGTFLTRTQATPWLLLRWIAGRPLSWNYIQK